MSNESVETRRLESIQLLEATHQFPCPFMFKVIGLHKNEFVARVLHTVRSCLKSVDDPPYSTRETASGRHISVTLEPHLASAEEVLRVYAEIKGIEGIVMVL